MPSCAFILCPLPHTAGNGGSFDKCRRRWDLANSPNLKYRWLMAFDRAMMHLDKVRACMLEGSLITPGGKDEGF